MQSFNNSNPVNVKSAVEAGTGLVFATKVSMNATLFLRAVDLQTAAVEPEGSFEIIQSNFRESQRDHW